MQQQLDKDSEKIYQSKIYPTDFMFTERKELKINHNELPGWLIATESSEKVMTARTYGSESIIFLCTTQYLCEWTHLYFNLCCLFASLHSNLDKISS